MVCLSCAVSCGVIAYGLCLPKRKGVDITVALDACCRKDARFSACTALFACAAVCMSITCSSSFWAIILCRLEYSLSVAGRATPIGSKLPGKSLN